MYCKVASNGQSIEFLSASYIIGRNSNLEDYALMFEKATLDPVCLGFAEYLRRYLQTGLPPEFRPTSAGDVDMSAANSSGDSLTKLFKRVGLSPDKDKFADL